MVHIVGAEIRASLIGEVTEDQGLEMPEKTRQQRTRGGRGWSGDGGLREGGVCRRVAGDEEFDDDDEEGTRAKVVTEEGGEAAGSRWKNGAGRVITKYKGWVGPRHRGRQAD